MIRLAYVGDSSLGLREYAAAIKRLRGMTLSVYVDVGAPASKDPLRLDSGSQSLTWDQFRSNSVNECDAICIQSDIRDRANFVRCASDMGKHVLVESPIATSPAEADEVIFACERAETCLMVAQPQRTRPSIVAVKQALESGRLGVPALLRSHCWHARGENSTLTKDLSPQEIWNRIVAQIDMATWLFQSSPVEVFALGGQSAVSGHHWPDPLQIHLTFPADGMALLSLTQDLPLGDPYETVSLIGSSGAAYADQHHQTQLLFRGGHAQGRCSDEAVLARLGLLKEFSASILERRRPNIPGADDRQAMQIARFVMQSLISKEPIRVVGGQDAKLQ